RPDPSGPRVSDRGGGGGAPPHMGIEVSLGSVDHDPAVGRGRRAGLGLRLGRLLPALRGRLPRAQIDGSVKRKITRLHDSILPYGRQFLIQGRWLARPARWPSWQRAGGRRRRPWLRPALRARAGFPDTAGCAVPL